MLVKHGLYLTGAISKQLDLFQQGCLSGIQKINPTDYVMNEDVLRSVNT